MFWVMEILAYLGGVQAILFYMFWGDGKIDLLGWWKGWLWVVFEHFICFGVVKGLGFLKYTY